MVLIQLILFIIDHVLTLEIPGISDSELNFEQERWWAMWQGSVHKDNKQIF